MTNGATVAIARFAITTPVSALPDDVVDMARRAILDTIGVTLAGSLEAPSHIVTEHAVSQSNACESVIWGTKLRVNAGLAALANGTASHVLDFDDTNDSMRGHPSVAILPAVYAMGERAGASGMDLLAAYVIGVEVACKLGLYTGQKPYDRGWHLTATHGVIGATVGVGRLAGLSAEQMQHAIGIAVSSASGIRGNFGSMTKSLHIGRLAQSAIMAVEMAQRGFTANTNAIDGDFGYWTVFGRDSRYADVPIESRLGNPFELVSPGFNVKAYPCCASTHAAIDVALAVREELSTTDIDRVIISVPYTAPLLLTHHRPTDPLSAKFSLEYCVAVALIDGTVTLDHFVPDSVMRPEVQKLLRRVDYLIPVEWQHDDGTAKTGFARIDVYIRDGTVHHAETAEVRGSPTRSLSDEELEAKFLDCARLVFKADRSQEILEAIKHVDQFITIRHLSNFLTGQALPHLNG